MTLNEAIETFKIGKAYSKGDIFKGIFLGYRYYESGTIGIRFANIGIKNPCIPSHDQYADGFLIFGFSLPHEEPQYWQEVTLSNITPE